MSGNFFIVLGGSYNSLVEKIYLIYLLLDYSNFSLKFKDALDSSLILNIYLLFFPKVDLYFKVFYFFILNSHFFSKSIRILNFNSILNWFLDIIGNCWVEFFLKAFWVIYIFISLNWNSSLYVKYRQLNKTSLLLKNIKVFSQVFWVQTLSLKFVSPQNLQSRFKRKKRAFKIQLAELQKKSSLHFCAGLQMQDPNWVCVYCDCVYVLWVCLK